MHDSVAHALNRMDAAREAWWMVRKDSDPRGVWRLSLNPTGEDWAVKIGVNKRYGVRRVTAARTAPVRVTKGTGNIIEVRRSVDKMRQAAADKRCRLQKARAWCRFT